MEQPKIGGKVVPFEEVIGSQWQEYELKFKNCPTCKTLLPDNVVACWNCGHYFGNIKSVKKPKGNKKKHLKTQA